MVGRLALQSGQGVQPAGPAVGLAVGALLQIALRVKVRASRRVRARCGHHAQHTLLPQGQQHRKGRVQAKRGVELQRGLVAAVRRGDGNAGSQGVVVRVGVGHQRRETVVGPAQQHNHESAVMGRVALCPRGRRRPQRCDAQQGFERVATTAVEFVKKRSSHVCSTCFICT